MINSTTIIGITGNIATGKSVIRRMLANTGVVGIDADVLAHRMLYPGGPAYLAVIEAFGPGITNHQQIISNKKLGEIVFNDPSKLKQLESLVHPPVIAAIHKRIKSCTHPILSIEAIKLLESGLAAQCDSVWVSYASSSHQVQRLIETRNLTEPEARSRISAQPAQSDKFSQADIIINTETSFKDTWLRTLRALNDTIQLVDTKTLPHINISEDWSVIPVTSASMTQVESAWIELAGCDTALLYEHLGLSMVIPILKENRIQAFAIWADWNFTATLQAVYPASFLSEMPGILFSSFETQARSHQTELMLVRKALINKGDSHPASHGWVDQQLDDISYPAWKIAAQKAVSADEPSLMVKRLSQPFECQDATIV
jgi:dephospho-CoA kinase